MRTITIYSTPTCTYCRAAKEFFNKHNLVYEEHAVASDMARRQEMLEKSGQMGVPVILIGPEEGVEGESEVVVGFDEARLSEMLGVS